MANQTATVLRGNNIETLPGALNRDVRRIKNLTADYTVTASDSGTFFTCNLAAGLDITLPAIGSVDVGMYFEFAVLTSVASTAMTVTAATGDLLIGGILLIDFDDVYTAPQGVFHEPDGSDDLILTFTSTDTTGGKTGSKFKYTAISPTNWWVEGILAGNGTMATPFS